MKYVVETSNMGCKADAVSYLISKKIPFAPAKRQCWRSGRLPALKCRKNASKLSWTAEEVDQKLHWIMTNIHGCLRCGRQSRMVTSTTSRGANIAGFKKSPTLCWSWAIDKEIPIRFRMGMYRKGLPDAKRRQSLLYRCG